MKEHKRFLCTNFAKVGQLSKVLIQHGPVTKNSLLDFDWLVWLGSYILLTGGMKCKIFTGESHIAITSLAVRFYCS